MRAYQKTNLHPFDATQIRSRQLLEPDSKVSRSAGSTIPKVTTWKGISPTKISWPLGWQSSFDLQVAVRMVHDTPTFENITIDQQDRPDTQFDSGQSANLSTDSTKAKPHTSSPDWDTGPLGWYGTVGLQGTEHLATDVVGTMVGPSG